MYRVSAICGWVILSKKNIEKITLDNKDEFVNIKGTISNIVNTEKVTIIKILQPQEITVGDEKFLIRDDGSSREIRPV